MVDLRNARSTLNAARFSLERRYSETQAQRLREAQEAIDRIGLLSDPEEQTVLRLRHVEGLRFSKIPERMFLSERSVYRRYKSAMAHYTDIATG